MFKVTILNPKETVYEGLVESVWLPGEYGEFEVLTFHEPIVSTLKAGTIRVDDRFFEIDHGVVRMDQNNKLVVVVNG